LVNDAKEKGAKIRITGFLDNNVLSQVLQECTLFVLPQQLPLTAKSSTAIAASVHGLPVISKSSDNPEYNYPYISDKNSILLDNMDEKSLAEACNNLILDLDKIKSIKSECLKLKSYFSWSSIAEKHNDLYDSLR
jgi:glycosyltransferase involved in cell wall biosynthesis